MVKVDIKEYIGVNVELLFQAKGMVKEENHLEQGIIVLLVREVIILLDVWRVVIGEYNGIRYRFHDIYGYGTV
tara:strand:+ start:508 stop:726 length:219 start_codon:yes stop_codon:yes gene_type:complete